MMQVGYSGTTGNTPRYLCGRNKALYGGERGCQSLGGRRLENRVLDEVFTMLEPASLAATAKALGEADANHRRHVAVFELTVERARFEAERARRQFDAVEPENRLVARTLEHALEGALAAQRQAEANLTAQRLRQPTRLTEEETAWLARAGADVRAVFHAPTTTWRARKQLLRALISEVVVTVDGVKRRAEVHIVWEGGATTAVGLDLNKTGKHFRTTDEDTVDLVRRLADRYDDKAIAAVLSRQGRRTGTGLLFTKTRVKSLRLSRGIAAYQPPAVTPAHDDGQVVSITKAEQILGVSRVTLYRWMHDGFIAGEQLTPGAPGTFGSPTTSSPHRPRRPRRLGRARQAARSSAWPARRCCTRSNAASSGRCIVDALCAPNSSRVFDHRERGPGASGCGRWTHRGAVISASIRVRRNSSGFHRWVFAVISSSGARRRTAASFRRRSPALRSAASGGRCGAHAGSPPNCSHSMAGPARAGRVSTSACPAVRGSRARRRPRPGSSARHRPATARTAPPVPAPR